MVVLSSASFTVLECDYIYFIVDNYIRNGIFNMLLLCMWTCEK